MAEKRKKPINLRFEDFDAKSVHIAGSFNDWSTSSHPLKQGTTSKTKGVWQRTLYLEPGEYEYRFFVDGAWRDDPNASERRTNEFGSNNLILRV
jgi:1,4-alpha-glucan branching enzyme